MITVCTAVYGRPEIFRLFLECFARLQPSPVIYVAGSPDDPCAEIAKLYPNCRYLNTYVNRPLGQKFNYVFQRAFESSFAEYFMVMGSDDLMDQPMWDYYNRFTGDYLGLSDYWFHNMGTEVSMYWPGYRGSRIGEPIGAARMISRRVMFALGGQPFSDHNDRIDHDFHHKTIGTGASLVSVKCADTGGMSVDLKTSENKNGWRLFTGAEFRPYADLKILSPFIGEIIDQYK